jgi:hypothetical protein
MIDRSFRQKGYSVRYQNPTDQLNKKSKDDITEGDVSNVVCDYLLAGSYSQIMSAEIKEIEESNGYGDIEKVTRITESIDTKAEGLFLSAGNQ